MKKLILVFIAGLLQNSAAWAADVHLPVNEKSAIDREARLNADYHMQMLGNQVYNGAGATSYGYFRYRLHEEEKRFARGDSGLFREAYNELNIHHGMRFHKVSQAEEARVYELVGKKIDLEIQGKTEFGVFVTRATKMIPGYGSMVSEDMTQATTRTSPVLTKFDSNSSPSFLKLAIYDVNRAALLQAAGKEVHPRALLLNEKAQKYMNANFAQSLSNNPKVVAQFKESQRNSEEIKRLNDTDFDLKWRSDLKSLKLKMPNLLRYSSNDQSNSVETKESLAEKVSPALESVAYTARSLGLAFENAGKPAQARIFNGLSEMTQKFLDTIKSPFATHPAFITMQMLSIGSIAHSMIMGAPQDNFREIVLEQLKTITNLIVEMQKQMHQRFDFLQYMMAVEFNHQRVMLISIDQQLKDIQSMVSKVIDHQRLQALDLYIGDIKRQNKEFQSISYDCLGEVITLDKNSQNFVRKCYSRLHSFATDGGNARYATPVFVWQASSSLPIPYGDLITSLIDLGANPSVASRRQGNDSISEIPDASKWIRGSQLLIELIRIAPNLEQILTTQSLDSWIKSGENFRSAQRDLLFTDGRLNTNPILNGLAALKKSFDLVLSKITKNVRIEAKGGPVPGFGPDQPKSGWSIAQTETNAGLAACDGKENFEYGKIAIDVTEYGPGVWTTRKAHNKDGYIYNFLRLPDPKKLIIPETLIEKIPPAARWSEFLGGGNIKLCLQKVIVRDFQSDIRTGIQKFKVEFHVEVRSVQRIEAKSGPNKETPVEKPLIGFLLINEGQTGFREPNHCGINLVEMAWNGYKAQQDGGYCRAVNHKGVIESVQIIHSWQPPEMKKNFEKIRDEVKAHLEEKEAAISEPLRTIIDSEFEPVRLHIHKLKALVRLGLPKETVQYGPMIVALDKLVSLFDSKELVHQILKDKRSVQDMQLKFEAIEHEIQRLAEDLESTMNLRPPNTDLDSLLIDLVRLKSYVQGKMRVSSGKSF